ncbi:MAG: TolC family protein [Myxococcota bacterium]|jgi:outer membrane protein TolC
MKKVFNCLLSSLLAASGFSAFAADPPPSVPPVTVKTTVGTAVDDLVAAALKNSPGVVTLKARLSASRERITSSTALPDPTLGLSALGMGVDRLDPYSYVMIDYRQELPYPGKRDARKASAEAETGMRKAELDELKGRLVEQIRVNYARIYAVDSEYRLLQSSGELLDLLKAAASVRYSSGRSEQEALIKVQLESTRNAERISEVEAERKMAVSMLGRLVAGDSTISLPIGATLPVVALPQGDTFELALKGASGIALKKAGLRLAQKKAGETRLGTKPDFGVGGGVGVGAMPMPMVLLKLDMSLPVWSGTKQEPEIRAAELEVQAAKADLKDAENMVRSEVERLLAQWSMDESLIERYREASIPQSKAAMDAAIAEYAAGKADFSMVIEDFRSWLEAVTQLARREADRYAVWAQVDALVSPVPVADEKGGR